MVERCLAFKAIGRWVKRWSKSCLAICLSRQIKQFDKIKRMREWLSGRALPCQGKCREFESRLPLHYSFNCLVSLNECFKLLRQKLLLEELGFQILRLLTLVPSPSGKARVCKTLIPSSSLGGTSKFAGVAEW